MNRPIFLLGIASVLGTAALQAQTPSNSAVTQPSSPAPAVGNTAPAATAPAIVQAPSATTPDTNNVTQIVYMPKLPSAADLTSAANAQGLTVERIVQTANQVIAFYRNANGQTTSVAYQSLPPSAAPAPTAAPTVAPVPQVVVTSPPPTVVYETAPSVVYYDYPRYYYPRVWYPPVSFSFGFHRSYGGHYHRHR